MRSPRVASGERVAGAAGGTRRDLEPGEAAARGREARALLGSLLRPFRVAMAVLAVAVIIENAARLAIPLMVKRGIDHAIPPLLAGGAAGS